MSEAYRAREISAQDGTRLFYRDYYPAGVDKTPLLCLPGLVRNSSDFERVAERYCPERRVIAVDYRGRGRSAWPDDAASYNPPTYLGDLHQVLAAANCHQVIAVGTSLGGLLVMAMGAMMPAVLAGAVLNDIGPELDETGVNRIQGYVGKTAPPRSFEEAADYLATNYGSAYPDYGPDDWLHEAHLTYREDGRGGLADNYDPRVSQSIAGGPPADLDFWALFASLSHVPVLSIRGATSDIFHPDTQKAMTERMPTLQTLTVASRGHAPSLDEPECLAALPAFFAECDAKAAERR